MNERQTQPLGDNDCQLLPVSQGLRQISNPLTECTR
jgi:hypothetical protein